VIVKNRCSETFMSDATPKGQWTYLTNHAHVLIALARDPNLRLRDVSQLVGITERAVQKIVLDLEEAGALTRLKSGRRNHYQIHTNAPMRHPLASGVTVGELLGVVVDDAETTSGSRLRPSG
jgi:hypothetical protein